MFRSNFCFVFQGDGFPKFSQLSLNCQICSFSTPQAPFRASWRRSHNKIRGLAPSDQSICHIKSTSLLVTVQFCLDEAQPVKRVMRTPYHLGHPFSLPQQQRLIRGRKVGQKGGHSERRKVPRASGPPCTLLAIHKCTPSIWSKHDYRTLSIWTIIEPLLQPMHTDRIARFVSVTSKLTLMVLPFSVRETNIALDAIML